MRSPMLDRAKIQAQVLVPLLRAFRESWAWSAPIASRGKDSKNGAPIPFAS
jgi:hypothetical protein